MEIKHLWRIILYPKYVLLSTAINAFLWQKWLIPLFTHFLTSYCYDTTACRHTFLTGVYTQHCVFVEKRVWALIYTNKN